MLERCRPAPRCCEVWWAVSLFTALSLMPRNICCWVDESRTFRNRNRSWIEHWTFATACIYSLRQPPLFCATLIIAVTKHRNSSHYCLPVQNPSTSLDTKWTNLILFPAPSLFAVLFLPVFGFVMDHQSPSSNLGFFILNPSSPIPSHDIVSFSDSHNYWLVSMFFY